jgi:hypothetical protein
MIEFVSEVFIPATISLFAQVYEYSSRAAAAAAATTTTTIIE